MEEGIRLHPKYGLNPTMPVCIICGKETGEIALLGATYKGEAPRHMIVGVEPCSDCKEKYLKNGVLLLETNSFQTDEPKIPTGRMVVITVECFKRIFSTYIASDHICWIGAGLLDKIMPKEEKK